MAVALAAAAAWVGVVGPGGGCDGKRGEKERAAAEPDAVYVVRGVIAALPTDAGVAGPIGDLMVHHEEIPNFADAEGKVVGMGEMIMPFPLGDGVSLNGLARGDKVEITFGVTWKGPGAGHRVTKVVKLAADTPLNLKEKSDR